MSTPVKPADPLELSIGALSSATGVPVDTLRTWERRYGFPAPTTRTEGSHRRYSADTIEVVQLIVQVLDLGHRPSAVIGRGAEELRQLVGTAHRGSPPVSEPTSREAGTVERWVELTRVMDGDALTSEFHRCLGEMAAIDFLERCMGPYLTEIGERWATGELRVLHEHFASEMAREFMSAQWRRLNERARDPARASIVLATPPAEQHVLGLHMAAWVIAGTDAHVVFLGADTPMAEVAYAASKYVAEGVALSVAAGYAGDLQRHVAELTSLLPPRVSVAVGGAGGREVPPPARRIGGLSELLTWAQWVGIRPR